jgi:hypothetical protein
VLNKVGIRILPGPSTPRSIGANVALTKSRVAGIRPAPGSSGGLSPTYDEVKRRDWFRDNVKRNPKGKR